MLSPSHTCSRKPPLIVKASEEAGVGNNPRAGLVNVAVTVLQI